MNSQERKEASGLSTVKVGENEALASAIRRFTRKC
ncbi:MAG: 30S ribosomal protein S21, partial [Clostridia bacterium]|nr:30S ribosomal protein S21 [Clostridia bacterium]